MEQNYVVSYGYYLTGGGYASNKMRVKHCMSELHAKLKLEKYLEKKITNFSRLVVYTCKVDNPNPFGSGSPFGDIFGDIFK